MTIRKQPNGKWLCECYPNGRDGKRVRKQFATKGEAVAFENFTMDEVNKKTMAGGKGRSAASVRSDRAMALTIRADARRPQTPDGET
ncbi:Fels-2 prophage protein [Escherichia coli]|nr:Fels-2 prophage protein [Escherichia coli]